MNKQVYAIEGLDRLGKSTLIRGIQDALGFYQVVHFGKPEELEIYSHAVPSIEDEVPLASFSKYIYQYETFRNSMLMTQSKTRLIFDRWHLGECVYAPLYRNYSGDYVFKLERMMQMERRSDIRLILLTEDFSNANHFESDGDSFDDKKRYEEQGLFINAFERSILPDKRIVCVTDVRTGKFRQPLDILEEALE